MSISPPFFQENRRNDMLETRCEYTNFIIIPLKPNARKNIGNIITNITNNLGLVSFSQNTSQNKLLKKIT